MPDRDASKQPPQLWAPGDRITAERLNRLVGAIRANQGTISPARQARIGEYAPGIVCQQFEVAAIYGEYIAAREYTGTSDEAISDYPNIQHVEYIARPYLLRTSIFTRSISGTTYHYSYSGVQSRTSTNAADGEDTEDQIITPSYQVGDIIYAIRPIVPGLLVMDSYGDYIQWIDLNIDGRMWAAEATE